MHGLRHFIVDDWHKLSKTLRKYGLASRRCYHSPFGICFVGFEMSIGCPYHIGPTHNLVDLRSLHKRFFDLQSFNDAFLLYFRLLCILQYIR
jgi:hypothetical protein